jgi:hypothetical protein
MIGLNFSGMIGEFYFYKKNIEGQDTRKNSATISIYGRFWGLVYSMFWAYYGKSTHQKHKLWGFAENFIKILFNNLFYYHKIFLFHFCSTICSANSDGWTMMKFSNFVTQNEPNETIEKESLTTIITVTPI